MKMAAPRRDFMKLIWPCRSTPGSGMGMGAGNRVLGWTRLLWVTDRWLIPWKTSSKGIKIRKNMESFPRGDGPEGQSPGTSVGIKARDSRPSVPAELGRSCARPPRGSF